MGMNPEIEALITGLNRVRKHLYSHEIILIDRLVKAGEQPDESQKEILYRAERRLTRDLGDEEFFRQAPSSN